MNDQLKKYVQDNRDEFDHLEPSAAVFLKLKSELKHTEKKKNGLLKLVVNPKWLVAASIFIMMFITYLLLNTKTQNQTINQSQFTKNILPKAFNEKTIVLPKKNNNITATKEGIKASNNFAKRKLKEAKNINMPAIYKDLTDSSSASTRLAAILKIQRSTIISYDIIDKMAKILNHDSNSNVRLAALTLMSKYAQDSYVNNAFMLSLSNQKDPLLQLGLMELLRQTDNPKLDDKLYALANDPTTLTEVKDQAYLILLNQNKL